MKKETVAKVIGIYSLVLGGLTGISVIGLFFLYFGCKIENNLKKNIRCKSEIKILMIFYVMFFFLGSGLIAFFTFKKYPLFFIVICLIFLIIFGTPLVFSLIFLHMEHKNPTTFGEINIYCDDKFSELKRLYDARIITKEMYENKKESLVKKQINID